MQKTLPTYAALPTCTSSHGASAAFGLAQRDHAAGLALTIQIVANQQRDDLRKQQRGV